MLDTVSYLLAGLSERSSDWPSERRWAEGSAEAWALRRAEASGGPTGGTWAEGLGGSWVVVKRLRSMHSAQ